MEGGECSADARQLFSAQHVYNSRGADGVFHGDRARASSDHATGDSSCNAKWVGMQNLKGSFGVARGRKAWKVEA